MIDDLSAAPPSSQANLPPTLAIAVTLAGALFEVLALVVASPLAVALLVVVKTLYVDDALGEGMGVMGVQSAE